MSKQGTWRTVQFFIGEEGVNEVSTEMDDPTQLRCTCPSFKRTTRCKHIRFIKEKTRANNGHYMIKIPNEVPPHKAEEALADPKAFREFLLRYGRPEEV